MLVLCHETPPSRVTEIIHRPTSVEAQLHEADVLDRRTALARLAQADLIHAGSALPGTPPAS